MMSVCRLTSSFQMSDAEYAIEEMNLLFGRSVSTVRVAGW